MKTQFSLPKFACAEPPKFACNETPKFGCNEPPKFGHEGDGQVHFAQSFAQAVGRGTRLNVMA